MSEIVYEVDTFPRWGEKLYYDNLMEAMIAASQAYQSRGTPYDKVYRVERTENDIRVRYTRQESICTAEQAHEWAQSRRRGAYLGKCPWFNGEVV